MTLIWAPHTIASVACPECGASTESPCVFSVKEAASILAQKRPRDSPLTDEVWVRQNFAETCHLTRHYWLGTSVNERERRRCHAALDSIYESLRFLEPTLTLEQIRLLPINECKYHKLPEWEDRYAYRQSKEGQASHMRAIRARVEQLREAFPDAPIPPMDDE